MTDNKQTENIKFYEITIYFILLILISMYVFNENDETQPVVEIFKLDYLIPVLIYSIATISISYIIFGFLKRIINRIISFTISLIIGIPLGLILMEKIFELI